MKHIFNVKNLNNSIRFYNRLLGSRPAILTSEYACYEPGIRNFEIELHEKVAGGDPTQTLDLVIPETDAYHSVFRQMKTFADSSPGMECKVAKNHFVLADPDANTWIIAKNKLTEREKDQISKNFNCFLEPFINNNNHGQSN